MKIICNILVEHIQSKVLEIDTPARMSLYLVIINNLRTDTIISILLLISVTYNFS